MGDFDLWKAVGVVTEKVGEIVRELTPPQPPATKASAQVCCLCGATGLMMKFPRGVACLTCMGTAFHGLVARVRDDGERIGHLQADQEIKKSLLQRLVQDFQVIESRAVTLSAELEKAQQCTRAASARAELLESEMETVRGELRAASARVEFLEAQRSVVVHPSALEGQRKLAEQLAEECYAYFRLNHPDSGPAAWSGLDHNIKRACVETLMPLAERLIVSECRLLAANSDGSLEEITNSQHIGP